jgi:hypothetical protein
MQGQILLLYLFICYVVLLSFFVVKPVKPINMKSNVCNSLNCSAQYIGCHDWNNISLILLIFYLLLNIIFCISRVATKLQSAYVLAKGGRAGVC